MEVSTRERDSSIDFSILLSRVVSAVGLPKAYNSPKGVGSWFEREVVPEWGVAAQREYLQVKKWRETS